MTYYIHLMLDNRWPQPNYKPLGSDTASTQYPHFKQGRIYQLRLAASTDDQSIWPEFVVIRTAIQVSHAATLAEVFLVLLSEYEQFVEPFQEWELN